MIGLYLITKQDPLEISTPLQTQTQLDKVNIYCQHT